MDLQKEFLKYALKEQNPIKNPARGKSEVKLKNLELTVKLLISFLTYEVDEPTLLRVKQTFESSFKKIIESNIEDFPSAIELLATNFESFIKKIAFIKYKNDYPEFWIGDEVYKGISKSNFGELLKSSLFPKEEIANEAIAPKPYPSILLDFKGIKQAIYDETRKIRNNVHIAKDYSSIELVTSLNVVLGAYLLAVEDNIDFLKSKLLDEYKELSKKINNAELRRIDKQYIELIGVENVEFESRVTEISNYSQLLTSIDNLDIEAERNDEAFESDLSNTKTDTIINIVKRNKSFALIGKPGSGKTTTIKKVFYQLATEFLESTEEKVYPILIDANTYNFENSFAKLIKNEIKSDSIEEFEVKHSLLILIDGLNELNEAYRANATAEIKYLLKNNEDVVFIISSRKHGYKPILNLPIFELNELTEYQIKEFVFKILGDKNGCNLWESILQNKGIYQLDFNPLYLKMIIKVFQIKNGKLPRNKGLLYKIFCEIILERESRVYTTDKTTKINILAHLAYWMRQNGIYKRIKKDLAINEIAFKLTNLNANISVNEILNELIDNEFFLDLDEELEFVHETYEEYFVSLEIKRIYIIKNCLPNDYYDNRWFEALEMTSDLFFTDEERTAFFNYLFIGEKSNTSKIINDISASDINSNFLIACKIAFNLKNEYPQGYTKAVTNVSNYLSIWLHHKINKIDFITFDKLLEAVALLSDIALFNKVFNSYDYIYYWLYDEEYDKLNNRNIITYKKSNIQFQNYFEIFIKSLNDFACFYYFIKKIEIEKHWFSKSIYSGLAIIKKAIPSTQEYNQLLKAFELTGEPKLISHIGALDIEFFIKNYPKREKYFYKFILKSAKYNHLSKSFLLDEVKNDNVEFSLKELIVSEFLGEFENTIEVSKVIDTLEIKLQERLLNSIVIRKGFYNIPIENINQLKLSKFLCNSMLNSLNAYIGIADTVIDGSIFKYADEISSINHQYGIDLTIHPDLIKSELLLNQSFEDFIFSEKEKRIIKQLGSTFLFEAIVNEKQLGYIINHQIKDDYIEFQVYLLKQKKLIDVKEFIVHNTVDDVTHKFCFVQSNIRLRFLNSTQLFEQFYITSFIVSVNENKSEGFIRNNDKQTMYGDKDFYFLFDNCPFKPEIGMSVTFLPAINSSKRYLNLPFAYDIKLNSTNVNIAIVTDYKKNERGIKLMLEDIRTKKKVVALINGNAIAKFSFTNEVIGRQFNYVVINENEGDPFKQTVVKIYPHLK